MRSIAFHKLRSLRSLRRGNKHPLSLGFIQRLQGYRPIVVDSLCKNQQAPAVLWLYIANTRIPADCPPTRTRPGMDFFGFIFEKQ